MSDDGKMGRMEENVQPTTSHNQAGRCYFAHTLVFSQRRVRAFVKGSSEFFLQNSDFFNLIILTLNSEFRLFSYTSDSELRIPAVFSYFSTLNS